MVDGVNDQSESDTVPACLQRSPVGVRGLAVPRSVPRSAVPELSSRCRPALPPVPSRVVRTFSTSSGEREEVDRATFLAQHPGQLIPPRSQAMRVTVPSEKPSMRR